MWRQFVRLWRNLAGLRNDLMHFGFGTSSRKEDSISQEVQRKIDELRSVVGEMGFRLPKPSSTPARRDGQTRASQGGGLGGQQTNAED